jgi:hypothetical protein
MYIIAPDSISTACFVSPICLCIYKCSPLSLLGSGSIKTLPLQRIHKQRYNFWTRRFLMIPVSYQGKVKISSSQNLLFKYYCSSQILWARSLVPNSASLS